MTTPLMIKGKIYDVEIPVAEKILELEQNLAHEQERCFVLGYSYGKRSESMGVGLSWIDYKRRRGLE